MRGMKQPCPLRVVAWSFPPSYVSGSVDHRVLHSFPARRSSDLGILTNRINGDNDNFGPRLSFAWNPTQFNHRAVVRGGFGVDRKSTRLNSSHTVISYAVFCLKKKTTEDRALHFVKLVYAPREEP